jgi:TRAP-type C4-dicarboxylate transport system substrate-binding protein
MELRMRKLGILILALGFCGIANAAVLKIATITPEGSQWMTDMRAGAKEIKERTDGRVQIKYYGGGIQGNDTKVLGKMRIGSLQGGAFTPTSLQALYPDLNLPGLPMMFESEEEAAYVRGFLDEKLKVGLEEVGYVSFGFAAGGFAVIMSNTPVRGLADLKGKRVWVPEGDKISYASMEALSLSPVTLPITDVLTGLQTGLLDIVATSPIGALVLQWHTKIDYITDMPLVYTLGFMAIQKKAFYRLSEGDQAIVNDVFTRMYENFDRTNLIDNQKAYEALLQPKTGIQLVSPEEDGFAQVRDVVRISNRRLGEQGDFSIELYEEMLQHIEDFRRENSAAAGE